MANPSRVSPIRIEKLTLQRVSIPDYSSVSSLEEDYGSTESEDMSTSPDTSYRSSADADKSFDPEEDFCKLVKFDDIIEKIENLRLTRNVGHENENKDDEDANENTDKTSCRVSQEDVDNVEYRDTYELRKNHHIDNEDINNNEDNVKIGKSEVCQTLNTYDEPRDQQRRRSLQDQDSTDENEESEQEQQQKHEDSDDSDLIERGPIKPDFRDFQTIRGHPYTMVNWLSRANDNVDAVHAVDYDKTAELILRNKDYSEKMNSCLDQLSNSSRNQLSIGAIVGGLATIDSGWTGENTNDNVFRNDEPNSDVSAAQLLLVFRHWYYGVYNCSEYTNVLSRYPNNLYYKRKDKWIISLL